MNTLRVSGPLEVGRGPFSMLLRTVAVSSLLCAAVFAGSFALGRAQRPRAASSEQLPPSLPASAAGPAIPVKLGSAPAFAVQAPAPTNTQADAAAARAGNTRTVTPASTRALEQPVAPPSTQSVPSTPVAPVATVPATSTPTTRAAPRQSSGGTSPSAPSGSHGSRAKTETGGSTSFDSSG
jgi:hypothetical protein